MSTKQPDDGLIAPMVMSRYRQIGVSPGWTKERFLALCGMMGRLPEEVGAMAGLIPSATRQMMGRDRFPVPVSLHFAVIDAVFRERNYGEPWEPIMPLDWLDKK